MAESRRQREPSSKAELQMTPLIDVTFLLLIFFLCSIKFKLLEGKLCTYLPKNSGVNASRETEILEKIVIRLERDGRIYLNGEEVFSHEELFTKVRRFHGLDPTLQVLLKPGQGVLHGQAVAVVNECLRAGIAAISFGRCP